MNTDEQGSAFIRGFSGSSPWLCASVAKLGLLFLVWRGERAVRSLKPEPELQTHWPDLRLLLS